MTILGLHHITLVCSDARRTVDFYTRVLGQRFIKKTVNFDDPGSYHLYFGNQTAEPGSAITFFEWPQAPKGAPGIGGTHHFALQVADRAGLLKWKRRLTDLGLTVKGPYDRQYFQSIYFDDPDGVHLEIATQEPGFTVDEPADQLGQVLLQPPSDKRIDGRDEQEIRSETWPEPVPDITEDMALEFGMHHITAIGANIVRTQQFFGDLLGMQRVKKTTNFDDPNSAHWYWGVDNGRPGTLITYFERDPQTTRPARMGAGQTHHFALAVEDEESQLQWRERLMRAGLSVTPVLDRVYFKSIYTRDPDGHIIELATLGPGFLIDEDLQNLGQQLRLPPWLEGQRASIEARLQPIEAITGQVSNA